MKYAFKVLFVVLVSGCTQTSAPIHNLHVVEVNDGDPAKPLVVFLHGSPGDLGVWGRYFEDDELKSKANLLAIDRPGFGGSRRRAVEPTFEGQIRQMAPLIDKANGRVILVGHSYGGPVAARMAIDRPAKVTDVVILAGAVDPADEQVNWYQYPAEWWLIAWALPSRLEASNHELLALKKELTELVPLWPRLTQNVSIIQGDSDTVVSPKNADFAEQHLTSASALNVIRISGAGHDLPGSQFDIVKAEILQHLK